MADPFNIIDLFLAAAEKQPGQPAIIYKNEPISFDKFKQQVILTASYFKQKGINAGDRVLVFVPMSINLYRIALALFYMGATAVFLDEWVSKKRLEECCKTARCKAFIGIWKVRLLAIFSSELRKIPIKLGTLYKNNIQEIAEKYPTTLQHTALITFTTGTTGTPKAAKRTHGFLYEQFKALIEKINPQPGEIDMPALPIVLLINLGAGCTSVIPDFKAGKPHEMNAARIWHQIAEHNVQRIVASPFFIKKLAIHLIENKIVNTGLQKIFTGGAPVFPKEARLYVKAFPNARIEIVYGSTEAEPISSIRAVDLLNNQSDLIEGGLQVGVPYRKALVRIISITNEPIKCSTEAELNAITLQDNNIGEIIVSGPHVLKKYFNNDAALWRNKIFVADKCWHRTGDSGYLQNNHLFLTGKMSTLISHNNGLISPFVVQTYLQAIPGVVMGTIVKLNNKLIIVLELKKEAEVRLVFKQVRDMNVNVDDIKTVPVIPRDPRHNSRIDYERLIESLTIKKRN